MIGILLQLAAGISTAPARPQTSLFFGSVMTPGGAADHYRRRAVPDSIDEAARTRLCEYSPGYGTYACSKFECIRSLESSSRMACLATGTEPGLRFFLPPYPDGWDWAPLELVKDGRKTVTELLGRAQARSLTSCHPAGDCTMVLVRRNVASEPAEEYYTLSSCDVPVVGGAVGPPRYCKDEAVVTPRQSWVRAALSYAPPPPPTTPSPPAPDPPAVIRQWDYWDFTRCVGGIAAGMRGAQLALDSEPFNMKTEVKRRSVLQGVNPGQWSKILQNSWEYTWVQFSFEESRVTNPVTPTGSPETYLGVRYDAALELLVSETRTLQPRAWHPPEMLAQEQFQATLRSAVERAVKQACQESPGRQ